MLILYSLLNAGFVINEEKSVWVPIKSITWLGLVWDSVDYVMKIPKKKELLNSWIIQTHYVQIVTARKVAQATGPVMSMSPVVG